MRVKRADMEQMGRCEAPAENSPQHRLCAGVLGGRSGGPLDYRGRAVPSSRRVGEGREDGLSEGWKWF